MSSLIKSLKQSLELDERIQSGGCRERLNQLRQWQCQRLLCSYDYLYQQKKYRPAMDFFTEELYGPGDFSRRDQDIEKVLPTMERLLSPTTLATFEIALQLNCLSFELDLALLDQLAPNQPITSQNYATAYQACANQALRSRQIDMIERLACDLEAIAKRRSILTLLKLCRTPARLAGLGELQQMLEKGAKAFNGLGNLDDFIQPILTGERALMVKLFAGENCLPAMEARP